MSADIWSILFFLFFEVALFFSSTRLFYIVVSEKSKNRFTVEKSIIGWLSISIILSVSIASFFSFMKFNGQVQYIIAALGILALTYALQRSNLYDYFRYLRDTLYKITKSSFNWRIVIIFIILLPMLWWGLKPSNSTDTLDFLNPTLAWSKNELTPYSNWANYIPFNQLSWVPSIVISSSDNYFWLSMIKPIILLGLVTYAIGTELKLNKNLIWLLVFSSLVFYRIWLGWGPAFGSIKEDALIGTGILLLAYSTLIGKKENLSRLSYLFFLLGIVFVTAKWPGMFLAMGALPLFVFVNWEEICKRKKTFFAWFGLTILIFMLLVGHIHIQHTLEYGHPFWPYKATIFGIELPGKIDASKTSILSNIDDIRVWKILFPVDSISPGGLLFPVTLAFGVLGSATLILYNLIKYFRRKKYDKIILFLSIFILMTWIVYFNLPATACAVNDPECNNVVQIKDLHSMRMQDGPIFLTELFFIFILVKFGVPNWIVYTIIGTNLISRIWLDYTRMTYIFDKSLEIEFLIYPIIVVAILFVVFKYFKNDKGRIIIFSSVGLITFIFIPLVVDDLREFQSPWWSEVRDAVHEVPASKIFLIDTVQGISFSATAEQAHPAAYIISGDRFQHEVKNGSFIELENILREDNLSKEHFDYIAFLCKKSSAECDKTKDALRMELEKYDYIESANAQSAIIFKFRN